MINEQSLVKTYPVLVVNNSERVIHIVTKRKSSSAFRTIGEVASELGVSPHVLRFWESKFTQIKPHKRRGGHRYYRPADIEVIKEIKSLLYEKGYTIKGAQKFLKDRKKAGIGQIQTSLFEEAEAMEKAAAQAEKTANPELKHRLDRLMEEMVEVRDILRTTSE